MNNKKLSLTKKILELLDKGSKTTKEMAKVSFYAFYRPSSLFHRIVEYDFPNL